MTNLLFAFTSLPLDCERAVEIFRPYRRCPRHRQSSLSRNRRNQGILSKARFDKTTQRNRRERRSQCESNFRRHARDETEFVSAVQAFYYDFVMREGQGNATA